MVTKWSPNGRQMYPLRSQRFRELKNAQSIDSCSIIISPNHGAVFMCSYFSPAKSPTLPTASRFSPPLLNGLSRGPTGGADRQLTGTLHLDSTDVLRFYDSTWRVVPQPFDPSGARHA